MKNIVILTACFLTACCALATPTIADAASVTIRNYSNDSVNVVVAYNRYKGDTVSKGWYVVKSNGVLTLEADDKSDMYVRIERNGKEVTFKNHKSYLFFPVNAERFSVSKTPTNAKIRVLRWGTNLQHTRNMNTGEELPAGWTDRRFTRIGSEDASLEIKPIN
ncbi:MAG: DUF1036 domain-containing protein [Planctomycetes bacterium]|nr:DUF1036 domain-containing protein [Planctomycetota bacterium]